MKQNSRRSITSQGCCRDQQSESTMALTDIPLDKIHEERLLGLIAAQAAEGLYIDYKSETYGGNDDQRREFLADVSSFANASGGDLVIGMTAGCGIPTGVHPFMGDGEAERLR